ncbi:MAG TPA: phasin family protein [Alphaproteobacteria bacterium]|jgi:hypothetical protein|nr:phasin family protein [Alphaproteobacteria bacterium]
MANQQTQTDMTEPKVEHIPGAETMKAAAEHVAGTAARATDEAARTARELTGVFASSYSVFADGIQELQHGYWRIVQQSVDIAAHAPAEMMRCRSLTELSELQREILTKCLDGVADANRTLMDVSARVAGSAVKPLQEHIGRA